MTEPSSKTDSPGIAADTAPKKRRARKASNYLVLRRLPQTFEPPSDGSIEAFCYEKVAANGTRKGCVKKIEDEKITGELLIVCVRDRVTVSVEQQVKMKHVRT